MSWAQRSAANLLPLSVEQRQFPVALHEWVYAGDMYDMERPAGTCELCEHPDIRYHFKIVNRHNGNEMLVGSECINRFGISATDPLGNILNVEESRRRVSRDRRFLVLLVCVPEAGTRGSPPRSCVERERNSGRPHRFHVYVRASS